MKKISLSLLMLLLVFNVRAQLFCGFTYQSNPGTNIVTFYPDSSFSPNLYHFVWDFGDGNSDSTISPTHIYNTPLPVYACCNIYNSANALVCSSCDSVGYNFQPPACSFSLNQTPASNLVTGQTISPSNTFTQWNMGDGGVLFGDNISYIYSAPGSYLVCVEQTDTLTGSIVCSSCQPVNITNSSSPCNFTFTQSGSSTFTFYSNINSTSNITWDFGDSTIVTGTNQITHSYVSPGPYQVCVSSTDTAGVTCNYCDQIYSGSGSCNFIFTPDLLSPNTFNFYGVSSGNTSTTLLWDFADGSIDSGLNVIHTFNSPGLYIVCMTEIDSTNTIICSYCDPVMVTSSTNCNFTSSVNPQNSLLVDFNAYAAGAPPVSVTWDFGDSTAGTGANPSHLYANSGTYLVCVTIGSGGSVVCSSCNWVTVGNNTGPCNIFFFPDSLQQFSYYFSLNTSSPSSTVAWDFGDNSTGTGSFVNHVYNAPGPYTVCAFERDSMQNIICQSCVSIFIGGGPVICQASFLSTSLGLTGYFIDLSVGNLNATSYNWDFGDGSTSTARFPQHTYAAPGTYTVCQTISSGNCTDQFCSPIIVDSIINPSGGCQAFFAIVQLAPYQVSVVNLSSGVNLGFSWDYGDGTYDSLPFPSHYYSSTGSYNLCLTVFDANGCSSTYCDTINVDSLGYVFRGMAGFSLNVFSPIQITAGVKEIKTVQSFKSFPNPVTSELHILASSANERITNYRVLSYQGAELLFGKLNSLEGTVNMQKLSAGSYLLEVSFTDGSKSYQSIIKN